MLVEAVETPVAVEDCKAVRPWKWYDTVLGASLAVLLAGSAAALAVAVADDFGYVTVKRDAFRHAYGAGTHLAVTTPPRGCYGNLGLEFSGSMEDCVVGRLLGDLEGDLKAGGYPEARVIRVHEADVGLLPDGTAAGEAVGGVLVCDGAVGLSQVRRGVPVMGSCTICKGDRVRARWYRGLPLGSWSLAGAQMKAAVEEVVVEGVIRHIRGDDPVAPTERAIFLDVDGQPSLARVRPPGCTCGGPGHVMVKPEWIRCVVQEGE